MVVVIIGILIAIAIPLYLNYKKGANDKSAQSDLRDAVTTLEQCNTDNAQLPDRIGIGLDGARRAHAAAPTSDQHLTAARRDLHARTRRPRHGAAPPAAGGDRQALLLRPARRRLGQDVSDQQLGRRPSSADLLIASTSCTRNCHCPPESPRLRRAVRVPEPAPISLTSPERPERSPTDADPASPPSACSGWPSAPSSTSSSTACRAASRWSSPGSHCPNCGDAVRARHNVPVLGWLMLRGRCADCARADQRALPAGRAGHRRAVRRDHRAARAPRICSRRCRPICSSSPSASR